MLLYRVSTVVLMVASVLNGFTTLGALVLFVHDIGDMVGSLLKALIETSFSRSIILTNYTILLFTWAYTRLYLLPFQVLPFIAVLNLPSSVIAPTIGPAFFTMLLVMSLHHVYWFVIFAYM